MRWRRDRCSRSQRGPRILRAIEATRAVVPFNTNLGIVLLCAPLAHAAVVVSVERAPARPTARRAAPGSTSRTLYWPTGAIRIASPGGLGRSERHDVAAAPQRYAARRDAEAQDRDRVARQYASDYRDIFETGLSALQHGLSRWRSRRWAAVHAYLEFLARFADSHIARKHGDEVAASVSVQRAN